MMGLDPRLCKQPPRQGIQGPRDMETKPQAETRHVFRSTRGHSCSEGAQSRWHLRGPPGSVSLWVEKQDRVFVIGTAGLPVGFLLVSVPHSYKLSICFKVALVRGLPGLPVGFLLVSVPHSYKLSICFKVALVRGLPGAALRISWVLVTPAASDPARKLMMLQCTYQPPLAALPGETSCLKTIFASKMPCGFSLQEKSLKP